MPIETQASAAVIIRSRVTRFSSRCASVAQGNDRDTSGLRRRRLRSAAGVAVCQGVSFEAGSGADTIMVSTTRPASAPTPGIGTAATFILAMLPIGFPYWPTLMAVRASA